MRTRESRIATLRMASAVFLVVVPASLLAQHPDISGTWVLNEPATQIPPPREDGARIYIPAAELEISVDGLTITVESWRSPRSESARERGASREAEPSVRTIFADGQQHTIVTESGDSVTWVARWEGDRLTVESERVIHFGMRRSVFRSSREYYLNVGAKQLVIEEQIANPTGGTTSVRLVYDSDG